MTRHIYAAKLEIGDKPFTVGMVVREDMNGNRFYDHELSEVKKTAEATPQSGVGQRNAPAGNPAPRQGTITNIASRALDVIPTPFQSQGLHGGAR